MQRLLLILCIFVLAVPIFAQENQPPPPGSLLQIHYALQTIDDLEARGSLSPELANTERQYYLAAAENLTGESLSQAEISERAFAPVDNNIFRFLSFVNILWALGGLIIVISFIWLFVIYIVPLIRRVPLVVYEILFYIAAFAFIWYGQYGTEGTEQFIALPGVLGLAVLLPFSYARRAAKRQLSNLFHQRALSILYLGLSLLWGFVAVQYQSEMIGFLTVIAGLWTLALTRWVKLLLQPFGYDKENPAIEIMVMCGFLMLIYLTAETRNLLGAYQVFGFGVYWIGNYGYFGALEVLSTKWQNSNQFRRYLYWQLFAIFSALLGLFIGIYWRVDSLSETAGTFILVYTLTKYLEAFNWRKHWAWASLGLGLLLYLFAYLINTYPQFFLLG